MSAAAALDPRPASVEVDVVIGIERGRGPTTGIQIPGYRWDNIEHTPPPPSIRERPYAVYHATDIARDNRLRYTTVIHVDRATGNVLVDERVGVERRLLLEWMDRERRLGGSFEARGRASLAERVARHRGAAERMRPRWLGRAVGSLVRAEAHLGVAFLRGVRGIMRGAVAVPDAVATAVLRAQAQLAHRMGRRLIARGLTDPGSLDAEQKSVVLVLIAAAFVTTLVLLNTLLVVALPALAVPYRSTLADAVLAFLGVLFLPIPTETLVIATTLTWGPVLAFVGPFVGKMAGAWVLYLLGDGLHDALAAATQRRPRMRRVVEWLQRSSDKHGFVLVILVNAIPVVPDVMMYVFAVSGMRFRTYFSAVAIGTGVKFAAIIAGILILGPERVTDFLASPFG